MIFHSLSEHQPPAQKNLKIFMDTIGSAIPSRKPTALPLLPELESLCNNNESATVASLSANSVAGSNYPLATTDNFSDEALPPITSPDINSVAFM